MSSAASLPSHAAETPASSGGARQWWTVAAAAIGIIMVAADGIFVILANPYLSSKFHASFADLQWIFDAYILALMAVLIPAGKIGDRIGHRKVFLTGVTGYAITSVLCAVSPNLPWLVTFRVFMGASGAMVATTVLSLLRAAFRATEVHRGIAVWGTASAIAVGFGPTIGGHLIDIHWTWVFFVNVPVAIIALVIGVFFLPETPRTDRQKFDYPGFCCIVAAVVALVWGVIKAGEESWTSGTTIGALIVAAVLFAAFIVIERRTPVPVIPLSLFSRRGLSLGVLLVLIGFTVNTVIFYVSFYLEGVRAMSASAAGNALLPLTLASIVGSPLGAFMAARVGARWAVGVGAVIAAVGLFGLSGTHAGEAYGGMVAWFILVGIGTGMLLLAATQAVLGNAPARLAGIASGVDQSAQFLGASLGTAVFGAIVANEVKSVFLGKLLAEPMARVAGPSYTGFAHAMASVPAVTSLVSQARAIVLFAGPGGARLAPFRGAFIDAANRAFLAGFSVMMVVAAVLAIVCALLGAFIPRHGDVSDDAVPAADAAVPSASGVGPAGAADLSGHPGLPRSRPAPRPPPHRERPHAT